MARTQRPTVQRLRRERAGFERILQMPQTKFSYRQVLRKAIAARDRAIQRRLCEDHRS